MGRFIRTLALMAALAVLSSGCVYFARVSVDAGGVQFDQSTVLLDVSSDGRYVLLATESDLTGSDDNGVYDIYRKDMLTGAIMLISQRAGVEGDGVSTDGEMSDDGRWVAYASEAANLVNGDSNGVRDVFLYDTVGNVTKRASVDDTGGQASSPSFHPAISGDGRHVAFAGQSALVSADTDSVTDVYRFDRVTDGVALVSSTSVGVVGNGSSSEPSVDYDGSIVVFQSTADNLIGGDTNGVSDIYGKFSGGLTVRVSVSATAGQATGASTMPSVAGNGLAVAFQSEAFDLTPNDLNGVEDVFVKTIVGPIFLASVADDDVTQGSNKSTGAHMNHDGTLVSFVTLAPELSGASGKVVAVVRDGVEGRTVVAGLTQAGQPIGGSPALMASGGLYVAYASSGIVVSPDTNGNAKDAFLRWWSEPEVTSISPSTISLGATQPVTISGSGFNRFADTSVYTNVSGADGITFSNIVVVDNNTITADVESVVGITDLGPKNLWVEAAGGGPGTTSGALANCQCLTVAL